VEVIKLKEGSMKHFAAAEGGKRPALIICPGGGYEFCSVREGAPVARSFARMGIEAYVLEYECEPVPLATRPLHTLAEAVKHVRQSTDVDKVAVGGFSAGAHLAGLLGTVWNSAEWFEAGTDLNAHRPDAMVLCYPVITAGEYAHRSSFERLAGKDIEAQQKFSLERLVSKDAPPAFLWHTLDDEAVPVENTLIMEAALRRAGVAHEVHLFPHGVHGMSLADLETYDPLRGRLPDRHVAHWATLCAEWLKE